jgi:prefoldin beta subunit
MAKISKDIEDKINEFQMLQGQLQMISAQRQQSHLQSDEMADAIKKLETASGKIYRFSGTLFLQSTKEEASKDVIEKMELIKVRETAFSRQEERLKKRLEELKAEIESAAGAD